MKIKEEKFNYVRLSMPHPLSKIRIYSAEIENKGEVKYVSIELNQDEDEIISMSCTCTCNTINISMNKNIIKCKHIKDFIDLLIRLGRYKSKSL